MAPAIPTTSRSVPRRSCRPPSGNSVSTDLPAPEPALSHLRRGEQSPALLLFRDKELLLRGPRRGRRRSGGQPSPFSISTAARRAVLRFALQHFDRILTQQGFQALMQQEMMRFRPASPARWASSQKGVRAHVEPNAAMVEEAVGSGESVDVDPMQMMYAALGANVSIS